MLLVIFNYQVSRGKRLARLLKEGKTRDLVTISALRNPSPVFRKRLHHRCLPPFWLFTACFFHVRVAAAVNNKLEMIFHDGGFQRD